MAQHPAAPNLTAAWRIPVRNSAVWAVALGAYICFSIGWRAVMAMVLGEPAVLILAALLAVPACLAGAGMAFWRRRPAGIHMLLISCAMSRIALAGLQRGREVASPPRPPTGRAALPAPRLRAGAPAV